MSLPMLPQDKANHVVYGAVTALVVILACWLVGNPHWLLASLIAVVIVAIGKEAVDRLRNAKAEEAGLPPKHGVEWMDVVATLAGGLMVVLPCLMVK